MKASKSVAVRLHSRGVPQNGYVGINEDATIFGYVWQDTITHMSYYLNEHFTPADVIKQARKGNGKFYFDVGNEFTINADVLEDAFKRLGLI